MNTSAQEWNTYIQTELPWISKILEGHSIILDKNQPHTKGERFLMQALTTAGGKKLILMGHTSIGEPVVIKATRDKAGIAELVHEKECRALLHQMNFAYDVFHSPKELAFIQDKDKLVSIQQFIPQTTQFIERPIKEQFDFALRAFKAQERARATTHKHFKQISTTFGNRRSAEYLHMYRAFQTVLKQKSLSNSVHKTISEGLKQLQDNQVRIEQYCGFLTHTDFVPHNFRIHEQTMYLLDFSSLRFGNKHESWARFLNFMTLYSPELEQLLITYIELNRSTEERQSLQLMRIFRLGEIITYYTNVIGSSTERLLTLNQARVTFWNEVLKAELQNQRVSRQIVLDYQTLRDTLRSPEEKERQIGLH